MYPGNIYTGSLVSNNRILSALMTMEGSSRWGKEQWQIENKCVAPFCKLASVHSEPHC